MRGKPASPDRRGPYGWCSDPEEARATATEEAQIARGLDDNDSDVHRILAALSIIQNDFDRALYHQERALELNPNDDIIVVQHGEVLTWVGLAQEGIELIRRAMRLNPHFPERYWSHLGRAYFVARRYADAIDAFGRIAAPDQFHHAFMAASYVMAGQAQLAASHAKAVLSREPAFRVGAYLSTLHYKNAEDAAHHREALMRAGLPE
jgi:adenylate cyclase